MLRRSLFHRDAGRLAEAKNDCDAILRQEAHQAHPEALQVRAWIAFAEDETSAARLDLERALESSPDAFAPLSRWYLCQIYAKEGLYTEALAATDLLLGEIRLKIQVDMQDLRYGDYQPLAAQLLLNSDVVGELCEQETPAIYHLRYNIHVKNEAFDEALEALNSIITQRYVAGEALYISALYQRSEIYKIKGETTLERTDLDTLLKVQPHHVEALQRRIRICQAAPNVANNQQRVLDEQTLSEGCAPITRKNYANVRFFVNDAAAQDAGVPLALQSNLIALTAALSGQLGVQLLHQIDFGDEPTERLQKRPRMNAAEDVFAITVASSSSDGSLYVSPITPGSPAGSQS